MRKVSQFLFILLTALLLTTSCTKEMLVDPSAPTDDRMVRVRISLKMPTAETPGTYALSDEQEGHVSDVYVFFFNRNDGKVYKVVKGENVNNVNNTKKTFTAQLVVNPSVASEFDVHVLANIESYLAGKDINSYVGKTRDQLYTLLQQSVTGKLHTAAGDFVMWGESEASLSTGAPIANISISLLRALARVDVGVGARGFGNGNNAAGAKIPFALKKVYVYKPNNAYSFLPLAGAYNELDNIVTAHSAVGGAITAAPFEYSTTGDLFTRGEIYLPESNIKMGVGAKPGDANHTKRCAIVVGGDYNNSGKTTYYRIDFNDNATPRGLIDLLRNHRYLIKIVSVSAEGLPTPDEAYDAILQNSNITVEITQWSDLSQDIIFDGANWVYVQKKQLILPGSANITEALVVGSNLPVADWEMSLDGITFSTLGTISNADFDVTKPTVSDGGSLLIKTRNTLAENESRQATLTLKIGRLKFTIDIKQLSDIPADWETGPDYPTDF